MVTENAERPEIPSDEELPGGTLSCLPDYLELMRACWAQDAAQRPSFAEVCRQLRQLLEREVEHRRQA